MDSVIHRSAGGDIPSKTLLTHLIRLLKDLFDFVDTVENSVPTVTVIRYRKHGTVRSGFPRGRPGGHAPTKYSAS